MSFFILPTDSQLIAAFILVVVPREIHLTKSLTLRKYNRMSGVSKRDVRRTAVVGTSEIDKGSNYI